MSGTPLEITRLRRLANAAREAAKRKDWKRNHRLCRLHDDLAVSLGIPSPRYDAEGSRQ